MKRALAIGIALVVQILALELALRFLLFSDSGIARRLGDSWRKADWFASTGEDDYWKLQYRFSDPRRRYDRPVRPDPECGWTGDIDPDTYMPVAPVDLRGRRPVLLYGDSFARCTTPSGSCFQDILETSALSDRYCLVNYGVGGFGADQAYLMLLRSIDRWKDLDPIVVFSLLIDDDLPRCLVSFRGWPKPRLRVEDGRLAAEPVAILDTQEYLAAHPVSIRSYLARFLVFGGGPTSSGFRSRLRARYERREEQIELGRKILEEMHAELEARGLDHFVLVFHGWEGLQPAPPAQWAEDLVVETTARLGVPTIGTRPFLIAAADGSSQVAQQRFIGGTERNAGHYNEIGNVVAFEALRQGIEGRFDTVDTSRVAGILHRFPYDDPANAPSMRILGCPASPRATDPTSIVRWAKTPYAPFDRKVKRDYLILRPGNGGNAGVRIALPELAHRLRGKAIAVAKGNEEGSHALRLSIRVDGRETLRSDVPAWPQGLELEVDLSGAKELEIGAETNGGRTPDAWVHIEDLRFE